MSPLHNQTTPCRPSTPSPSKAPGRRTRRRWWRGPVRLLLWVTILAAGTLLYLELFGLPGGLRRRLVADLRNRGLAVEIDHIGFDLTRGLIGEGCRYFGAPGDPRPLIEVREVSLGADPRQWLSRRSGIQRLRIRGGTLRFEPEPGLTSGETSPPLVIEEVDGDLAFAADGIYVRELAGRCLDFDIHGQGLVQHRAGKRPDEIPADAPSVAESVRTLMRTPPSWWPGLVSQLKALQFSADPRLDVTFAVRPGVPYGSLLELRLQAEETHLRGLRFDAFEFRGRLRGQRLECDELTARIGGQMARISGWYDLETEEVAANVFTGLSPLYWRALMPIAWRDRMDAMHLFFAGPVNCVVELGPAPRRDLASAVSGWVRAEEAQVRDIWLQNAEASFRLEGDVIHLEDVDAQVGRDRQQGPARGRFRYDLSTKDFEGQLDGAFDWAAVLPVLSPGQTRFVRSLELGGPPPHVRAGFAGRWEAPERFTLRAEIEARDLYYRGAHMDRFSAVVTSTNEVLALSSLLAEREEGNAEGRILIDFPNRVVDLDLNTRIHPHAIGRTAGPTVSRSLEYFRFEGPTSTQINGRIHLGHPEENDLLAVARGRHIGIRWFLADEASFEYRLQGHRSTISNLVFRGLDGSGSGVVEVYPEEGDLRTRLRLDLEAVRFGDVVKQVFHQEGVAQPGHLSGRMDLTWLLSDDQGYTVAGEGRVHVEGAHLYQVPLLGGLSGFLAQIHPKLGFTTQTNFDATFTVREKQVFSEDATLEGDVFHIEGHGQYGIEEERLDFRVEVRPLRRDAVGLVGPVVHLLTSPLTQFLEFRLGGTLSTPEWHAVNPLDQLIPKTE